MSINMKQIKLNPFAALDFVPRLAVRMTPIVKVRFSSCLNKKKVFFQNQVIVRKAVVHA